MSSPAATAACPECDGAVVFGRSPMAGEVVRCTDCSAELEVISREPLTLELAPEVEEDWGE
ncbi:MAG: lysine biosynthesis protein LysW [Phycisphaerales bacterium]|nr:lysine biosynthesis protein LysW [Phycisphaerales bacterium]